MDLVAERSADARGLSRRHDRDDGAGWRDVVDPVGVDLDLELDGLAGGVARRADGGGLAEQRREHQGVQCAPGEQVRAVDVEPVWGLALGDAPAHDPAGVVELGVRQRGQRLPDVLHRPPRRLRNLLEGDGLTAGDEPEHRRLQPGDGVVATPQGVGQGGGECVKVCHESSPRSRVSGFRMGSGVRQPRSSASLPSTTCQRFAAGGWPRRPPSIHPVTRLNRGRATAPAECGATATGGRSAPCPAGRAPRTCAGEVVRGRGRAREWPCAEGSPGTALHPLERIRCGFVGVRHIPTTLGRLGGPGQERDERGLRRSGAGYGAGR